EIVKIHLKIEMDENYSYSPKEEAAVVIIKGLINKELGTLKIKQLPKEFLIKTLTEGGKKAFSLATSDPFELIISEMASKSVDEIIDILKEKGVYISSGETELSYTDINQKKRKEIIYHSIAMNKKTGEISVFFYSNKEIFAPRSNPGFEPANYKWSRSDFKGEKLKPFTVTFSGTMVEGYAGVLKFVGDVDFNVEFLNQDEMEELRNVVIIQAPSVWDGMKETAINAGGFFVEKTGETADLVGDGWEKTKEITVDIGSFCVEKTGEAADFVGDGWDKTRTFVGGAFGGLSGVTSYNKERGVVIDLADINRNRSFNFTQPEEKVDDRVDDKKEEEVEIKMATETEEETKKEQDQEEVVISVELNSALGEHLELLSGIGPVYAERIIENRPFCSLDDLTKVSGIGETTLRNIREQGLAYVNPAGICFQEEEIEEEKIDEDILEKFEEIKRRMERLREKVDERTGNEKEQEEIEEEEENEEEQEQEEVTSVEINSASKEELYLLIGIGFTYAERIIENRPFCSLDDLEKVSGIGEKTIENIKNQGLAYIEAPDSCLEEDDDDDDDSGGGGGGSSSPPDNNEDDEDDSDEEDEEGGDDDDEDEGGGNDEDDSGEGDDGDESNDNEGDQEEKKEITINPSDLFFTIYKNSEERVEINSASKNDLTIIKHIGNSRADDIIENRPFCSIDGLMEISGISLSRVGDIKEEGIGYVKPDEECLKEAIYFHKEQISLETSSEEGIEWEIKDENNDTSELEWLSFSQTKGTLENFKDIEVLIIDNDGKIESGTYEETFYLKAEEAGIKEEINIVLVVEDLIQQKIIPTINLTSSEYDLYSSSDIVIDINWNDAEQEIKKVVYNNESVESVLVENNDYSIENNQLTIYQQFFNNKVLEKGNILNFEIFFNIEKISFQIEIVDTTLEIKITGAETIWKVGLADGNIDASETSRQFFDRAIVSYADDAWDSEMIKKQIDASDTLRQSFSEAIVSYADDLITNELKQNSL
ncbi:MAG: helix-hairpin-helix domain-containing protein, partial [Patescibacteria group bacterium]|nr:helix-hairpin-helix domain-containing protein [Patescibacteria group bacterium]